MGRRLLLSSELCARRMAERRRRERVQTRAWLASAILREIGGCYCCNMVSPSEQRWESRMLKRRSPTIVFMIFSCYFSTSYFAQIEKAVISINIDFQEYSRVISEEMVTSISCLPARAYGEIGRCQKCVHAVHNRRTTGCGGGPPFLLPWNWRSAPQCGDLCRRTSENRLFESDLQARHAELLLAYFSKHSTYYE